MSGALTHVLSIRITVPQITVYDVNSEQGLDEVMLSAMLSALRPNEDTNKAYFEVAYDKLHLAMLFQNVDRARTHLEELKQKSVG